MTRASTILVIDDEEPTRAAIARILRADGHVVIATGRGVDAHWCVERHGPEVDLVVADFAAPEADGYHLGITVGALLLHRPVLFISSNGRDESVRRGLLHPGAPFLRKPFSPRVLMRTVRAILEQRSIPPAA